MRIGFFLREAFRALSRSAAPSLAAMLTILITALVLGVFIPIVQATTGTANSIRGKLVVDVFIKPNATDAQKAQLHQALLAMPNVKTVQYISKSQALKSMQKRNKEAFALLGTNPLPDSFRLTPRDPDGINAIADDLAPRAPAIDGGQRQPRLPAVDEVRNRRDETSKILSATGLVKLLTAGLAILLVLTSIALIANTIRLSIFARRREIEVMKLVGASNWFIRGPFMLEGLFTGLIGAILAVIVLFIGKETVVSSIWFKDQGVHALAFPLNGLILVALGLLLGAAASMLTLRRFLKV